MSPVNIKPRQKNGRDRAGVPGLRQNACYFLTLDEKALIERAAAIDKKTRSRYTADVLVAAAKETIRKWKEP